MILILLTIFISLACVSITVCIIANVIYILKLRRARR